MKCNGVSYIYSGNATKGTKKGRESVSGVFELPLGGNCRVSGILRTSQTGVSGWPQGKKKKIVQVCVSESKGRREIEG